MATEPDTLDLPVLDLDVHLRRHETPQLAAEAAIEASRAAEALHKYGVVIVRDPRASEGENDQFLDMLEKYFELPEETKLVDVRKEYFYQVGATPSRVELPRNHCERMKAFKDADKPLSL